jgi:hypothetical protein
MHTFDELDEYFATGNDSKGRGPNYRVISRNLILAIGGQCRSITRLDRQYAVQCFSRAQKAAFTGLLEDPCLDMVRCFLLMAFYELGACRRNSAFMYIGIASKAAAALGLHEMSQYQYFSEADRRTR